MALKKRFVTFSAVRYGLFLRYMVYCLYIACNTTTVFDAF